MEILYNGLSNPSGIITLNDVPNILSIKSDAILGSRAELRINVDNLAKVSMGKEYSITINGNTIVSTNGKAANREFYITQNNSSQDLVAVAASITRAFRNSGLVNYEVYLLVENGILKNVVIVLAREIGALYNIEYKSTLGDIVSTLNLLGSTTDEFVNSRICVDVYSDSDYITTLEKDYYKERIDFNLSLVLTTISRYDYLTPYKLIMYSDNGTKIKNIGLFSNLKSVMGYMCNQGKKYLGLGLALNVGRGTLEGILNKMTLYTYLPDIALSFYSETNIAVEIKYLDASKTAFRTVNKTIYPFAGYAFTNLLLEPEYFNKAFYIDVVLTGIGTLRYNVIKPLNATGRCLRVYYHNSYGGVSFFDFTGEIVENHKTNNGTYTKNIFGYYEESSQELLKVYDKENEIVVIMKSHLMDRSAVWQFNDLMGSYDVWTTINGVDYKIIVTDCKVDETETGVWQATVTYTYSLV